MKSAVPPARWALASEFRELDISQQAEVRRRAQDLLHSHTKNAAWNVAMSQVQHLISKGDI